MIDKARVKQLFIDLIGINSPSKQERGVADYLKAKLTSLGFEVEEDNAGGKIGGNAGNVMACMKGTAPGGRGIFFSCHMDTVEPTDKLKLVEKDGVLQSDGSTILGADDKGGIAAVIEGALSVIESGEPHGDIQLLFDISEETGLLGARYVDHSRIKGKLGYVFDTSRPAGGITVSAPSHETLAVEITGVAAHAGMAPERGVSAIVAASNAISKMTLGRIDDETTANIGTISGGKARNIIPDKVIIKGEARSRCEEKLVAQVEHMRRVFEEEAAKIGAKAEVMSQREYSAYRWGEDDEVVKLAVAASRRIGMEPSFQEGGGGSDANIFNSVGIPTVVIGVGYDNPHAANEIMPIDELEQAAEYAAALILEAAKS